MRIVYKRVEYLKIGKCFILRLHHMNNNYNDEYFDSMHSFFFFKFIVWSTSEQDNANYVYRDNIKNSVEHFQ